MVAQSCLRSQGIAATFLTLIITNHDVLKRLRWHRDHDAKPYARERCAAILKIAESQTPHAVALRGLLKPRDPDTVYASLTAYETGGVDELLAHPPRAYRAPTCVHKRAEVEERCVNRRLLRAIQCGDQSCIGAWRYRLVELRANFKWLANYSLSGVWRLMNRLDIGWKPGYINYRSPDPEYQVKLRFIEECLSIVAADPQHNVAIFVDEMTYHRWPSAAPDWWPRSQTVPRAEHGSCNNPQWRVIGGLNASTGQVSYLQNYIVGRRQVI